MWSESASVSLNGSRINTYSGWRLPMLPFAVTTTTTLPAAASRLRCFIAVRRGAVMATRETSTKKSTEEAPAKGTNSNFRIKVRMYRQGLGDCFLITIPRKTGAPFYMVIDCGVILGTEKSGEVMKGVVEHIIKTTNGHVDLLAATHEHWDHISGFGQAREIWTDKSRLTIGQVWLSWAEDPNDPLARKLKGERQKMNIALQAAASRMRLAGDVDAAQDVTNLMSFFAAAGTTADALETVKSLSDNLRYCKPQDQPIKLDGT